ncbi:MAG: division/cell wall cluster transcriptional repressor MraZ [Candidatus Dojkabacteria bacterium]
MLIGQFAGKVTEKNRLAVPAKFRDDFDGDLVISRGYEGCLILLDQERWENLIKLVSSKPLLNLSIRDTRRFLVGGAHELDLDGQGRFVLPVGLKTYAAIETEVTFVAIMDWVEIWAQDRWEEKLEKLTESAGDIADKLMSER